MLFGLFFAKPPLDEESVQWLFEVFAWALRNCDAGVFYDETLLVRPTNDHFPGRENSVHGMAQLVFRETAAYAGMGHWPFRLMEPGAPFPSEPPKLEIRGPLRSSGGTVTAAVHSTDPIPIPYDPNLIGNPEALIAGFTQTLAHYLGSAVQEPSPGGLQNWPQATEVLAVFLGFGLMFANTAFNFQSRSCGSCGGPSAQRQAFLSQYDVTYALALFCVLKGIPKSDVLRHLKKSLRPYFKRCVRDIESRPVELDALKAIPKR
ncbi:MAG: hypothetical protein U9Q81_26220 [Pseudomonadota bacterium]|nr:hypothetical protein [Pseudomonadota bacterium]